ncbi:hypothetical protein JW756_05095 [Candidatus Woesearchaeota archaeon]|nr:hypothetical protein [Candidatus Woesearchaeota archaeon]
MNKSLKLDQHFLKDEHVLSRIIEAASLQPVDIVLDIGAGNGVLTAELAKSAKQVIAIELDKGFKPFLDKMPGNVRVMYCDALEIIDEKELKRQEIKFNKIVANIPYAISEPLFRKLLSLDFELAVLLIGKNFYETFTSKESKWGIIAPLFYDATEIISVPPHCFEPEPRVDSVVVLIEKRNSPISKQEKLMKELVLQDDKKLSNALINSFTRVEGLTQKQAKEKVSKLGIDEKLLEKRVMHLSNVQFIQVSSKLSS